MYLSQGKKLYIYFYIFLYAFETHLLLADILKRLRQFYSGKDPLRFFLYLISTNYI